MTEKKEFEVDTRRLVRAMIKKSWLIGLVAILCAGAVLLGGIALTGEAYTAQVLFCVDTGAENVTNQTLTAARDLADSCGVLLQTQSCLHLVSLKADADVTANMLTGAAVNETEFFRVTVRAEDPETAEAIAVAVAEVLPELAGEYLSGAQLKLVDPAGAAVREVLNYVNLAATGFLLGLLLSATAVTVLEIRKMK